jgi:hypothetical protein
MPLLSTASPLRKRNCFTVIKWHFPNIFLQLSPFNSPSTLRSARVIVVAGDDHENKLVERKIAFASPLNNDIYIKTVGISDVIGLEIWNKLSVENKKKLSAFASAKIRPEGVDKDLWEMLEDSEKSEIKICWNDSEEEKEFNNRKIYKDGRVIPLDRPEEIDPRIWKSLFLLIQKKIVGKIGSLRPRVVEAELWENLNERDRQHINLDQKSADDAKDLKAAWLPSFLIEEVVHQPKGKRKGITYYGGFRDWLTNLG